MQNIDDVQVNQILRVNDWSFLTTYPFNINHCKSISKVSIGIQYSGLLCELSGNYIEVIIEENSFRI